MWIDGINDMTSGNKSINPGQEKKTGRNTEGRVKDNKKGKYRGNRGWRRLVQEVSKRRPLIDCNGRSREEREFGKWKTCIMETNFDDKNLEIRDLKKCRRIEMGSSGMIIQ